MNKEKKDDEKKMRKIEKKEFLNNLKGISPTQSISVDCNKCDVKTESFNKLKYHERIYHMQACLTQTEEIVLEDKIAQTNMCELICTKNVETNTK